MKILAVSPEGADLKYFEKVPPLGMLWPGGELRKAGYGVHFLNQQIDAPEPARVAFAVKPSLVLIGGTSHSRFASFDLAHRIKEVCL